MDYINLLYFSNEKEKEIFISDIARLLNTLNIDDQTNIVTGRKKLIEYNWNNGNETKLLTPSIHLELLHRVYFYKYRESTKTTFVHDIPEHLLNKINEYNNTRKTQ